MNITHITLLILISIVIIAISGCVTTEIPQSAKQDQLILVVPDELLQPIEPLQTIKPVKEQNE